MKYLRLLLIVGATLLSSTVWAESGSDRSIERSPLCATRLRRPWWRKPPRRLSNWGPRRLAGRGAARLSACKVEHELLMQY
jgi:hypothetical protein